MSSEKKYITITEAWGIMKRLGCRSTKEQAVEIMQKNNLGRAVYSSYVIDKGLLHKYLHGVAL